MNLGDLDFSSDPDAGISDGDFALANPGTATVTVQNAVGVRAVGCTTYNATVADNGSDTGITVDTDSLDASIDGQPCGLTMTTGNLSFDLDFENIAAGVNNAEFRVTVTGNI